MRNKGYFDFREEYINFRVDSFSNYKLLNLHVDVDSLSGTEPHKKYYIDEIYIVPDFNVEGSRGINGDTILVSDGRAGGDRVERDYHYISTVNKFRPRSLTRLIKLTKGEPYSEKEYRNTINQFLELGVFRFVNIRFEKEADSKLKAYILLTPADRWAASLELEGHTKNGDSYENANLGTALKGALKNKNFFGGGELMNFNLAGALEFNCDRNPNTQRLNTTNVLAEVNLKILNSFFPFKVKKSVGPTTNFSASYNRIDRVGLYNVNEAEFAYGWDWHPSSKFRLIVRPLNWRYLRLGNTSPEFEQTLQTNTRLRNSLESVSILGGSVSVNYNNQELNRPGDFFFVRFTLEGAGNLYSLLDSRPNGERKIFGQPHSQFLRSEVDLRRYWQINRNNLVVGRVYSGAGWAYGNSAELPYSRQFFAGGSTSLRAFRIRGIGPGTSPGDFDEGGDEFDRFGDYKFEANLEWRFPIITVFKGAFFVDAGNVWIDQEQDNFVKPGEFVNASRAIQELGVGGGFGLRVDFGYFILRMDTAVPFRGSSFENPNLHQFDWIILNEADPFDKAWRKRNIRFNFGIGYPF